jgi:hypothetical protein
LQGYQNLNPNQRRERFLEIARRSEQEVRSTLRDPQIQRLKQVRTQLLGPMAFNEPEMVQALELTEPQRQAMRQIESEAFALLRERQDVTDEAARRALRETIFKSALEKDLALLTPEQRQKWDARVGPPFTGRLTSAPLGMIPRP